MNINSEIMPSNVSGVLPIAFDDSLKALQVLLLDTKEYMAIMKLHGQADKKSIQKIFKEFTGPIYQTPPVRSAGAVCWRPSARPWL